MGETRREGTDQPPPTEGSQGTAGDLNTRLQAGGQSAAKPDSPGDVTNIVPPVEIVSGQTSDHLSLDLSRQMGNNFSLDTVESFWHKLLHVVDGNNASRFDIPGAGARIIKLEEQLYQDPFPDVGRISSADILRAGATIARLREQVEDELEQRGLETEEIINKAKFELFPGSTIPKLQLSFGDDADIGKASYHQGSGKLQLWAGYVIGDEKDDSRDATESLLHELKHGEQDSLVIRMLIDEELKTTPQASSLTKRQEKNIQDMYKKIAGSDLDKEILREIFVLRGGRMLTDEEAARASALALSFQNPANTEYNWLVKGLMSWKAISLGVAEPGSHLEDDTWLTELHWADAVSGYNFLFHGNIPDEIRDVIRETHERGGFLKLSRGRRLEVATIVRSALRQQLEQDKGAEDEYRERYLATLHEREATNTEKRWKMLEAQKSQPVTDIPLTAGTTPVRHPGDIQSSAKPTAETLPVITIEDLRRQLETAQREGRMEDAKNIERTLLHTEAKGSDPGQADLARSAETTELKEGTELKKTGELGGAGPAAFAAVILAGKWYFDNHQKQE